MKIIREYYGSGDHTGEVFVKEYSTFDLLETWEYRTMTKTLVQAFYKNGKAFEKKQNGRWTRIA